MILSINGVTFSDISGFSHNDCELFIVFEKGHKYSSMEEIINKFEDAGLIVGNYRFKGISVFNYEDALEKMNTQGNNIFDENGETSVLCVIPENIRNTFELYSHP